MIRVGIVGITGYTGEELLRITSKHPDVIITGLYARKSFVGQSIKNIYPYFDHLNLIVEQFDSNKIIKKSDVIFLALPHAVAFDLVPKFIDAGVKVIDLSADFRLHNVDIYETWYKVTHPSKEYISKAIYGLSEIYSKDIKKANLIANPGCYPTSVILGCAPAIINNIVNLDDILIDAKSGISGAGRKNAKEFFQTEYPNFKAYKIAGRHRHIPEIEQELSILSNKTNIIINFTPHIIPIERGMFSTIYLKLKHNIKKNIIIDYYKNFYFNSSFVHIKDDVLPCTKNVVNTNLCEIGLDIDYRTNRLIIVSVIDNLLKGAAGQAVQNMNIMFNLQETTGLL